MQELLPQTQKNLRELRGKARLTLTPKTILTTKMWKMTLSKVEYGSQLLHTFTNELYRPIYSPIYEEGICRRLRSVGGRSRWSADLGGRSAD